MVICLAASPFAEGEVSLVYHAQMASTKDKLMLNPPLVLKIYNHAKKCVNSRKQYFKQMEVSIIACFLTNKYNEEEAPCHCAQIMFLPVMVVEEEDSSMEEPGSCQFCAEEHLTENGTEFAKYSNNTGHWDEDLLDKSLLSFTK